MSALMHAAQRALRAAARGTARACAAGAVLLAGCDHAPPGPTSQPDTLRVAVGIAPLAYLVDRIGGESVQVEVILAPGQSPHTYEPTPGQVARMSAARLLFTCGLPFEQQIARSVSGRAGIDCIDLGAGLRRLPDVHHDHPHATHAEPHAGEHGSAHPAAASGGAAEAPHSLGALDPHIWLSPRLMQQAARRIGDGLTRAAPRHAAAFQANLAALEADLDALDRRIAQRLAPYRGRSFYVFHAALAYFAEDYGLRQECVEVEGKEPTPRQLAELVERARGAGVKTLLLEEQFSPAAAQAIARQIGARVETLDLLQGDYIANMDAVAEKIAAALREQSP